MPNKRNQQIQKNSSAKQATPSPNPGRKAPGTRMGTLNDWRQASGNSGKPAGRHGHSIRDGR
jgi:hypothetical protein